MDSRIIFSFTYADCFISFYWIEFDVITQSIQFEQWEYHNWGKWNLMSVISSCTKFDFYYRNKRFKWRTISIYPFFYSFDLHILIYFIFIWTQYREHIIDYICFYCLSQDHWIMPVHRKDWLSHTRSIVNSLASKKNGYSWFASITKRFPIKWNVPQITAAKKKLKKAQQTHIVSNMWAQTHRMKFAHAHSLSQH